MRDLILVVPRMPNNRSVSGVGNYAEKLCALLSNHGMRVIIVAPVDRLETDVHPRFVPIRYNRTIHGILKSVIEPLRIKGMTRLLDNILKAWYVSRYFRNRKNKYRGAIVQVTNHKLLHLFMPRSRKFVLVVRLSTSRRLWDDADGSKSVSSRIIEALDISARTKADYVLSPSKFLVRYYKRYKPMCTYLPSPIVDQDLIGEVAALSTGKYLIHYGTLSVRKGTDILIRNLDRIIRIVPDFKLVCVGTFGRSLSRTQQAVLHDSPCVRYYSAMPHGQVLQFVHDAHGVIIPSRADNLPNAYLEAVMLGKIVIVPHDTGVDEASFSYPGIIKFTTDDDDSFVRAIERAWKQSRTQHPETLDVTRNEIEKHNRITVAFYRRINGVTLDASCTKRKQRQKCV